MEALVVRRDSTANGNEVANIPFVDGKRRAVVYENRAALVGEHITAGTDGGDYALHLNCIVEGCSAKHIRQWFSWFGFNCSKHWLLGGVFVFNKHIFAILAVGIFVVKNGYDARRSWLRRCEARNVVLFAVPDGLVVVVLHLIDGGSADGRNLFGKANCYIICKLNSRAVAQCEVSEIRIAEESGHKVASRHLVGEIVFRANCLQIGAHAHFSGELCIG